MCEAKNGLCKSTPELCERRQGAAGCFGLFENRWHHDDLHGVFSAHPFDGTFSVDRGFWLIIRRKMT